MSNDMLHTIRTSSMANGKHPREMNEDELFRYSEQLYWITYDLISFLASLRIPEDSHFRTHDTHDFLNRQMQRLLDE